MKKRFIALGSIITLGWVIFSNFFLFDLSLNIISLRALLLTTSIPYSVEIINITYSDLGRDNNYDKQKIQFKVYAKVSDKYSKSELDSIGDRINYNLRKSLAICFNSTSSTNKLYNPVFSPHYVFTTANIKWV